MLGISLYTLHQQSSILFSSHGTHKLITKILWHPPKYIFFWSDKIYRYNFAVFVPDGYCCVGCCHFLKFDNLREHRSVYLTSQVLHVLKIIAAHGLKIAAVGWRHFKQKIGFYLKEDWVCSVILMVLFWDVSLFFLLVAYTRGLTDLCSSLLYSPEAFHQCRPVEGSC